MTCSRAGARHGMRDAVPPCEMRYRGEAGTGRRNLSRRRPGHPRRLHRPIPPRPPPDAPGGDLAGEELARHAPPAPRRTRRRLEQTVTAGPRAPPPSTTPRITPGRRTRTPSQHPPDEEDPPEQTATTTFTLHAFKTAPEQHSRCVVLPDGGTLPFQATVLSVSMHLQVRGAP